MVIWIIGMSASGKTTIGKKLYDKLSLANEKWIFLDGDTFRSILGEDLGHTIEDRRTNAYRISRFCEFLNSQGINVLACVLSIFHDNQQYNKDNIANYKEVFIDVDFDELIKRDNKELYSKALNGEIKNVVGVDIEFKPPFSPDLVIDNNKVNPDFESITGEIIDKFDIKIESKYSYTKSNLLENPHKYQYSLYEGKDFFIKYENDRQEALTFFKERLEYLTKVNLKSNDLEYHFYIENNNLVLKDFLVFLLQNGDRELEKQKSIIELLIKRFEVGKKLYLTYDIKEIRKSSLYFDNLINYPLFSLVLQKYYHIEKSEKKLIYLNAILKINDILSSIRKNIIIPIEITNAIEAINGELEITKEHL
jgi:cytidine diphosphoramidate kinase